MNNYILISFPKTLFSFFDHPDEKVSTRWYILYQPYRLRARPHSVIPVTSVLPHAFGSLAVGQILQLHKATVKLGVIRDLIHSLMTGGLTG